MNPALPGGAPSSTDASGIGTWSVSGRLSYAGVPYRTLQQGTMEGPNPNALSVDVHLTTAELAAQAPWGSRLILQLPAGRLSTSTLADERTDTDLGDAELRLRHLLPALSKLQVELGAGLVLPTGPYVPRSGAANLPPEASFLTLGRGVSWAIAEAQLSTTLRRNLSLYGELSARTPLGRTEDDFDWGNEVRGAVGGRYALPLGISALLIGEWQWRGRATEPDPFVGGRVESANAGGHWLTAMAGASYELSQTLSLLGGVRIPVHSDVRGNQLVPSTGAFLSLSGRWSAASTGQKSPEPEAPLVPGPEPGAITVIDYWATWCKPCETIDEKLTKAAPNWPDVVIKKFDASDIADLSSILPDGASGLPVIEIFDASGTRRHVLVGPAALEVVDVVHRMRSQPSSP